MAWFILIASGVFEAVWATALGKSGGFTKLTPTLIFLAALAVSMVGLAYAMRTLPPGTSYAVWVGVGAALTVAYAIFSGTEPASLLRILLLIGLISCIVGLKIVQ